MYTKGYKWWWRSGLKTDDIVLDPCCGTAGFLIAAMHNMLSQATSESQKKNIRQKQLHVHRNILEYVDGEYIITNPITETNLKEMRLNMDEVDAESFDKFVEKHWGRTLKSTVQVSTSPVEEPKRRGRRSTKKEI